MKFDRTAVTFTFSYLLDASISQPTVVFYSKEYAFKQGIQMKLTDSKGTELVKDVDYTESVPGTFQIINKTLDGELLTVFIERASTLFLAQ